MRALILLPSGIRGGAENVAFILSEELASAGWQVTIRTMVGGEKPDLVRLAQVRNIEVIVGKEASERRGLLPTLIFLLRSSRIHHYDLAYSTHAHTNAFLGLCRHLRIFRCSRLVARESTRVFDRFKGWSRIVFYCLYFVGYRQQDLHIFQTPEMRESLKRGLGYLPVTKSIVIANPISPRYEGASEGTPEKVLPPQSAKPLIVVCGRFIALKNFSAVIESFAHLVGSGVPHDLRLIGDGAERKALEELADSLGIKQRVEFVGSVDNPYDYLKDAHIGVISSLTEGFPNVLLEMMDAGVKQIVSTPCTESISSIPNISVTRGMTSSAISKSLAEVIEADEDRSREYRKYLLEYHSATYFMKQVAGLD